MEESSIRRKSVNRSLCITVSQRAELTCLGSVELCLLNDSQWISQITCLFFPPKIYVFPSYFCGLLKGRADGRMAAKKEISSTGELWAA